MQVRVVESGVPIKSDCGVVCDGWLKGCCELGVSKHSCQGRKRESIRCGYSPLAIVLTPQARARLSIRVPEPHRHRNLCCAAAMGVVRQGFPELTVCPHFSCFSLPARSFRPAALKACLCCSCFAGLHAQVFLLRSLAPHTVCSQLEPHRH